MASHSASSAKSGNSTPLRLKKAAPYFVLVFAIFAAYGNVYGNAFLYDDESLILKNVFLHDWSHLGDIFTNSITAGANIAGGFYRPLQIFAYFLIYQVAENSPFAFHLLNVSLHAANACLLYRLGCKLRLNRTAVFFATLIWALHPVHVEVIAYMSGTADPLYVLFTLLGLLVMIPRFGPREILISIPFFVLAILSKEEAILFPLLAMSCMFLLDRERFKLKTYVCLWPLWVIAGLYILIHTFFLNFGGFQLHKGHDIYADDIIVRAITFLATMPSYLGFIVWPFHLHFDRNFPVVADPFNLPVMGGIAMTGIAATQIIVGRTRRALAFSWGLLWFAAADLLHTGILIPVNASLLEHWLYLPSAGLFLGVAQSLASVKWQRKERKPFAMTVLTATALFLGVLTYQQNKIWHDAEGFYLNIFKNGEPSPHAHNNLGVLYALSGRYRESLEQFETSIELSGDANPQSQQDLAIVLLNGPEGPRYRQEAITHLERALEIDPDYYPASEALAALYDISGETDKAAFYRQKAKDSHAKMIGP